jgi:hypothetical protein
LLKLLVDEFLLLLLEAEAGEGFFLFESCRGCGISGAVGRRRWAGTPDLDEALLERAVKALDELDLSGREVGGVDAMLAEDAFHSGPLVLERLRGRPLWGLRVVGPVGEVG